VFGVSKLHSCTCGSGRLGSALNCCKIPAHVPAVVVGTTRGLASIAAQDKKEQSRNTYCARKMTQKSLYLVPEAHAIPVVHFQYNTSILLGL